MIKLISMACDFKDKVVYLFTNSSNIDKTAVSLLAIGFPVAVPHDCPWKVDGAIIIPEGYINSRGYIRGGLQYFHDHMPGFDVILAEEQVTAEDVLKVCDVLDKFDGAIVLGVRNMSHMEPGFERFAYRMIRSVYNLIQGRRIRDIYTGIRGIPGSLAGIFSDMDGDGSRFLLGQMMALRRLGIPVEQCEVSVHGPVKGVHTPGELLRDLWLVAKLFLKFVSTSFAAFLVDGSIYSLAVGFLPDSTSIAVFDVFIIDKILLCQIIALSISSTFNFIVNQRLVFKERGIKMLLKYYLLVVINLILKAFLLKKVFINLFGFNPYVSYLFAQIIVYVSSFVFQRDFVFKKSRKRTEA